MIEFRIYWRYSKFIGIPVGRLYIPPSWASDPHIMHLYQSLHILDEHLYMNGAKRIWFIAPVSLYFYFASQYPDPKLATYTLYLLRKASTFFKGLKPPYLPDNEYLD